MMRNLLVMFGLLAASSATDYNVLFLGNSYTRYNNMATEMVVEFAKINGDTITATQYAQNNGELKQYLDAGVLDNLITGKTYDVVVIQEQSSNLARPYDWLKANTYATTDTLLVKLRETSNPRIVWYNTWGRPGKHEEGLCMKDASGEGTDGYTPFCSYDGMQNRLSESYCYLAYKYQPSEVAPVGPALQRLKNKVNYALWEKFYDADKSHPSPIGSYLIASVISQTITGNHNVRGDSRSYKIDGYSVEELKVVNKLARSVINDKTKNWKADASTTNPCPKCGD